jgi:hypothetical protein
MYANQYEANAALSYQREISNRMSHLSRDNILCNIFFSERL